MSVLSTSLRLALIFAFKHVLHPLLLLHQCKTLCTHLTPQNDFINLY